MAITDAYAPTTWGAPQEFDFTCPSGQKCRMRYVQAEDILAMGFMDELDNLSGIVASEQIPSKGKKRPQDKPKSKKQQEEESGRAFFNIMKDSEKGPALMYMVNAVICQAVIYPALTSAFKGDKKDFVKIPESERKADLIYSDTVNFADKMEIFGKAMEGLGDLQDLEQFRKEQAQDVGNLANKPELEDKTE